MRRRRTRREVILKTPSRLAISQSTDFIAACTIAAALLVASERLPASALCASARPHAHVGQSRRRFRLRHALTSTADLKLFAQAVMLITVFYDGLVVPGALLLLGSGIWLIVSYYDGWSFLTIPWLAGMVLLFAFEFIEGNTITRLYFMRLRPSRGRLWMWDEPRRSLREPAASSSLRSPISLTCRFLS